MQAHRKNRQVVLAVTAVASAVVLLGFDIERRVFSLASAVHQPAPAADSAESNVSANPLELSVFDEPRALPDIRFADDQGHDLTLADFRGRVVLLIVWATWCVPCRKEMPALDRLQARRGGKDFLVIPLSIDREGIVPVKRFYQEVGVEKLAIYVDPSGRGSHGLAIPGVPTTLLTDREGREVARKMGAAEWDGAEMVSLVERTMHRGSASSGGGDR
jgi:thiol-disulfide isomerase/thioredoxin